MSMIDPTEDHGDTVLATKNPTESQTGPGSTQQGETLDEAETPLLVDVQLSQQQEGKLSPTAKYSTDRYRLARPFTSLH